MLGRAPVLQPPGCIAPRFLPHANRIVQRIRATNAADRGDGTLSSSDNNGILAEPADYCPAICDIEGFSSGDVRGAAVKYNDPPRLPLRRRGFLQWEPGKPQRVLIVKKPGNQAANQKMAQIGEWLKDRGLSIYVESSVWNDFRQYELLTSENRSTIDFCITLGGDGTVLHLASLFDTDEPMPPVMSFAMGSLGFLTPFDAAEYETFLTRVLTTNRQPVYCTLRSRMRCEVHVQGRPKAVHHVLNEVVIDRGAFPGTVLLELFIDNSYVTTVEADGLIIATPSGSTAYSMSAGGSLIAPSVPCTIISPIAPLSLSFRPVVIPESSGIAVTLPAYARSCARISFDGKKPMMLPKGSHVKFESTSNPLPMINLSNLDIDWYEGISQKLKWNLALRPTPKPLGDKEQPTLTGMPATESFDDFSLGHDWEQE